jgi:prepilin-type N-terminal cleavage/methylation domain-containing protein
MPTSSTGDGAAGAAAAAHVRAFTVVEIMVVMVVVAVLAGMIVPRAWGGARRAQLRQACLRLQATSEHARDLAASRRCDCLLVIGREDGSFGLVCQVDPERDPARLEKVALGPGKSERLGDGLRFAEVTVAEDKRNREFGDAEHVAIRFRPDGRADAAVVQVANDAETCSLVVVPSTGKARLVAGAETELPDDRIDLDA